MRMLLFFLMICALESKAQIITTIAGTGTIGFSGDDSLATNAELNYPIGVAVDFLGNVYISDYNNFRVRKVDTLGIITTYAGNGIHGFSGNDVPATAAAFTECDYLYVNTDGNSYVPDALDRRIRKINIEDTVTTFAGTGIEGYTGDGYPATAAKLGTPVGITMDRFGNVYYADDAYCVIRKINTVGIITTVAGNGIVGYSGNGGNADSAELQNPVDVAVDNRGNLYISDLNNNVIRKVDTNHVITTFAGTGVFGYTGDNGPATEATFNYPEGIAVDGAGNVFFADQGNNVIRKIDTFGIITTIVGNGYGAGSSGTIGGSTGDGGPAIEAELFAPAGINFDAHGNLYIADWYNHRIRKVTHVGVPLNQGEAQKVEDKEVIVYPNPAANKINIEGVLGCEVVIYDVVGRDVKSVISTKNIVVIDVSTLQKGIYFVEIVNREKGIREARRFVKE